MTCVILAILFLLRLRLQSKKTPMLTFPQAQRLVVASFSEQELKMIKAIEILKYNTRRNHHFDLRPQQALILTVQDGDYLRFPEHGVLPPVDVSGFHYGEDRFIFHIHHLFCSNNLAVFHLSHVVREF